MKNLQKIVIIDDEMVLRNGLKYLCDWEAHGFTIAGEASNGIEGFQLIQEIRPDIVITDIVMPGMDGISLTAQIKEHFPNIHIIVLSSYDNFAYAKSSFKLSKVPPLSFSKKFLHSAAWRRRNIWRNLMTEVSILKKKYHIR